MSTAWIDDDGGGVSAITYVGTADTSLSTITIPATAQDGDIAVLYDYAQNSSGTPSLVTPAGWANRVDDTLSTTLRVAVATKILTGADAGASITGMNGTFGNRKMMLVFRPDAPITTASYSTFNSEFTAGNPAAQVVAAAGQSPPLIVLGGCGHDASPAFTTASPAFDAVIVPAHGFFRMGYKLYSSAPADHTIDMADLGSQNSLWSGYIALQ